VNGDVGCYVTCDLCRLAPFLDARNCNSGDSCSVEYLKVVYERAIWKYEKQVGVIGLLGWMLQKLVVSIIGLSRYISVTVFS
jgi:hypothetical protein